MGIRACPEIGSGSERDGRYAQASGTGIHDNPDPNAGVYTAFYGVGGYVGRWTAISRVGFSKS